MSLNINNKPLFFIDGEELKQFANSPSQEDVIGVAYEWEGENVFHLHFSPVNHSFGKQHVVRFTKKEWKGDDVSSLLPFVMKHSIERPHHAVRYTKEGFSYSVDITSIDFDIIVIVNTNGLAVLSMKSCSHPVIFPSIIPARTDIYSRSKGLLELDILERKRVMIVGLGSFGSQIAIELAKAGVGHFTLMDFDRVELHNLVRHTATTHDLGRLKTDVIADAVVGKNPYAKVERFPININEYPDLLVEQCAKADLVICATDNNKSRFNLSDALCKTSTVGIFGRAITRAEGGDVFCYRPGGPCYCCLLGNGWYDATMEEITDESSARRDGHIAAYVSADDADAMVQVGLSADIEPMCNMMVKLALVELSRGASSGITSLEEELVFAYYMWANRRERNYTNWASFANPGQLPTIMRWYGVELDRDEECALCGSASNLDIGGNFVKEFGDDVANVVTDTSINLDDLDSYQNVNDTAPQD